MGLPRAYRKGYLKLSLATCPVALYPNRYYGAKRHSK
jgi:non-homologous end joining protein Ku